MMSFLNLAGLTGYRCFFWMLGRAIILATATFWICGCEIERNREADDDSGEPAATEEPAPAPAPAAEPAPAPAPAPAANGFDDLDISNTATLGTHAGVKPQEAAPTRALFSADVEGDAVRLNYQTLSWPTQGSDKKVDARVYIFWQEGGQVLGGHFDWKGVGQTVKTLSNIYGGYLGRKPPRGTTVWFALVSIDGSERTNVKQSATPWP